MTKLEKLLLDKKVAGERYLIKSEEKANAYRTWVKAQDVYWKEWHKKYDDKG